MANPFAIKVQFEGLREAFQALEQLKQSAARGVLRTAVTKASRRILAAAKALCPVEEGMVKGRTGKLRTNPGILKRSLGIKIVTYPKTGVVVGIIGPRKGFAQDLIVGQRTIKHDPVTYAHLVEFGHKIVAAGSLVKGKKGTGTVIGTVAAKPFLRPAFDGTKSAVRGLMIEEIKAGIEKALARGRGKK